MNATLGSALANMYFDIGKYDLVLLPWLCILLCLPARVDITLHHPRPGKKVYALFICLHYT